tara:strand:- start:952 stop:1128 length:177 start_codon:yes stop_codon:yes gene_type:complete
MGILDIFLDKIFDELGIDGEVVDKLKSIVDNVDVRKEGDKTYIEISMKKVTVVLEKDS